MTYEQKFEIALGLEDAGITLTNLCDLQYAISMNDQERIDSEYAWMLDTIENLGIKPNNLKSILRWIDQF